MYVWFIWAINPSYESRAISKVPHIIRKVFVSKHDIDLIELMI